MGCICVKPTEEGGYRFPIPNENVAIPFPQMLHYVHRFIWQNNFSSPVEERLKSTTSSRARVLNVKCGEGAWLKDNASIYPSADFFGCDITATLQYDVSPSFLKADILDGLRYYDKNTFDFIYLQFGLYTENDWQEKVIKELVRLCKPGGWIEIMDCDNKFYNERETTKQLGQACEQ
jgi:SAM-dependent methyltransferase